MPSKTTQPGDEGLELLEQETVWQGHFRIERMTLRHRRHDGSWTPPYTREIFERGHAVAVLPYDPRLDRVVLIEQLRPARLLAGRAALELEVVAGIVEPGETHEQVAERELMEEAGLRALSLRPLLSYFSSPGGTSETIALYLAEVDAGEAGGHHGLAQEHEEIRVLSLPAQEAFRLLDQGALENGTAILALQWLALHHDRLRGRDGLPPAAAGR